MDAVLTESPFADFGEDALWPFARTALSRVEGESADQLRSGTRQFAPRVPGVYGMLDPLGRLIYVGKSKNLRSRLLSYFLPKCEDDKSGRIVQSTCAIVWEPQPSEFAALLREQFLIRTFQPRFNVQGMPRRQQAIYVCLGRGPAEQLYTARRRDSGAMCTIGPLFGAGRANHAVEVLNRIFRLRDCSVKQPCSFTDQLQLFDIELRPGCIRLEIQSCLGPCISACSRSAYDQQVARAELFLQGKDDSPLDEIRNSMEQAATHMHFEQAARLREDLRVVSWLSRRVTDLAQAREQYTFVYPVTGMGVRRAAGTGQSKQDIWYLIRRGLVEGAVAAPRNPEQRRRTRQVLRQWLDGDNRIGTQFTPRQETLALVTSWFRNHRSELKQTFLPGSQSSSRRRHHPAGQAVIVKV